MAPVTSVIDPQDYDPKYLLTFSLTDSQQVCLQMEYNGVYVASSPTGISDEDETTIETLLTGMAAWLATQTSVASGSANLQKITESQTVIYPS